jgi:hypothetical protein
VKKNRDKLIKFRPETPTTSDPFTEVIAEVLQFKCGRGNRQYATLKNSLKQELAKNVVIIIRYKPT